MPNKNNAVIDDADDEAGIEVDLTPQRKSRKFSGTDADPIDEETGEEVFSDLTPRLRNLKVDDAREEPEDEDEDEREEEDEDEDLERDEDDEDLADDLEAVDSDEEDRPTKKGKNKPSKWKRRLERERRLREEEQENSRELRERLEKIEKTVTAGANTETFNRESAELKQKIKDTNTEIAAAIEDGDSAKQAELNDKLVDLKVELKAKQVTYERAQEEAKTVAQARSADTIVVRKVKQWVRKHPRYQRDIEFQSFVKGVDKAVAQAGYDPESDDFYRELDRRIKKRYPEEYKMGKSRDEDIDDEGEEEETPKPRRKHPSANMRRGNDKPAKENGGFNIKNGKVRLTPRQMQNMRAFQMDPSNPDDVREYVTNNLKK